MSSDTTSKLESLVEALSNLVDWYEVEMERSEYADDEVPKGLQELEAEVKKYRS